RAGDDRGPEAIRRARPCAWNTSHRRHAHSFRERDVPSRRVEPGARSDSPGSQRMAAKDGRVRRDRRFRSGVARSGPTDPDAAQVRLRRSPAPERPRLSRDGRRDRSRVVRGEALSHAALRTILPVAGWNTEYARAVEITGVGDPILPTPFRIGETSAAAIAAVGLAVSELWEL